MVEYLYPCTHPVFAATFPERGSVVAVRLMLLVVWVAVVAVLASLTSLPQTMTLTRVGLTWVALTWVALTWVTRLAALIRRTLHMAR